MDPVHYGMGARPGPSMVWYGIVLYGMIWYNNCMLLYGIIWYGMVVSGVGDHRLQGMGAMVHVSTRGDFL